MKFLKALALMTFLFLVNPNVHAYDDYDNYESYDSIVGDLSSRTSSPSEKVFDIDSLKLHAGFGFNNTVARLKPVENAPRRITLQGFQLSLGVDMFSPNFITEVGLINYNSTLKNEHTYKMREFDLKTYYRNHINRIIAIRGGVGLGVRYIDINSPTHSSDYTSPVSQILLGGEAKLGKQLSFVSELSYKSSLTSNSPETSAVDLTFRVDGHF